MDTNNASKPKKKRDISQEPKRIIVIGIYEDPDKGLLIVRKDDGSFQLPGGIIWRKARHGQQKKQLRDERRKLAKTVFEKSGLSLDVGPYMGLYNIQNPESGQFNLYKVFILLQRSTPAKKNWQRLEGFDGEFIPADLYLIQDYYPTLSETDKDLLAEYFDWYPQAGDNDPSGFCLKEVKTLA